MAKKDKQQEPKTNPKTAPKAPALNKDGKTVAKEPVVKEDANKNIRYVDTVDETKYKKEIRNGEEVWVHREKKPGDTTPVKPIKPKLKAPVVNKGEPVKIKQPKPSKTEPTELEDVVRMKKKEPTPPVVVPTEHKIKGDAEIYRMIDNEKTGMSNGKYTAYNYPDKEGRYTNTAETRYFDRQGNQIDPSKSYDDKGNFVPSIIPGSTLNEGANVGGLTRIMPVGMNQVDKPNADYSGNLMSGEYNITKNAQGGSGITNYAGAPKTFVMPKYDALGKIIPSANTGVIYDKAIADKVNAIKGSAGSFKLANQISPEDIKPKEEEVITIPRFKKGGLVSKTDEPKAKLKAPALNKDGKKIVKEPAVKEPVVKEELLKIKQPKPTYGTDLYTEKKMSPEQWDKYNTALGNTKDAHASGKGRYAEYFNPSEYVYDESDALNKGYKKIGDVGTTVDYNKDITYKPLKQYGYKEPIRQQVIKPWTPAGTTPEGYGLFTKNQDPKLGQFINKDGYYVPLSTLKEDATPSVIYPSIAAKPTTIAPTTAASTTITPIQKKAKGGLVGKIKGYYLGTPEGGVEGPSSLSGNPTINSGPSTPSGNKGNFYQNEESGVVGQNDVYAEQKAKDKTTEDAKKAKNDANARSVANAAGQALGGYGAAYYSSQKPTSEADATRSGAMSAVSQSGAIGGAIGGIAAIGDKIGGKKKLQYEAMDAEGNLLDEGRSKRNAIGGGLLSPSKALAYRSESGNWGDVKGDKYNAFIEGKAKKQIAEVKAANVASKQNQAIAARDAGNFNPTMTDAYDLEGATFGKDQQLILANNQQFDKNRPMMNKGGIVGKVKSMYADGGEIKGKGTAKSDSISAEVEEGSFVVPAVNAELAKGIRKLYLKAPNKKANLNQKEGEEVKLSNGEHLFTPQENEYLESIGINLEELAPNAEHEEEGKANGGLTSSKAKMILHDKSVHGKPLTDQQRKFFGAIAGGESVKGYMAGGMIKGYANGTTGDGVEGEPNKDDVNDKAKRVVDAEKEVSKLAKDLANFKVTRKVTDNIATTKKLNDKVENDKLLALNKAKGDLKNETTYYETAKAKPKLEVFNPKEYKAKNDFVYSGTGKEFENAEKALTQRRKDLKEEDISNLKSAASGNVISKINLQKRTDEIWNEIADIDDSLDEIKKTKTNLKSSTEAKAGQEPNLEVKPKSKQSDKTYEELIKKPYDARVTDAQWKKAVDDSIASGATIPKGAVAPTGGTQVTTAKKGMKAPRTKEVFEQMPQRGSALEGLQQDIALRESANLEEADKNISTTPIKEAPSTETGKVAAKKGWADKLGNIDPTSFVGIGQTAIGLNMLKGEKRPIDRAVIDPAYNANVERSMQDARFGLTPEQRIAANQDIQNALNDAKFQGLNTSGGSGIQAFNTNRAAINDAWRNKLGLQEADTNLRMQKQQYADAQVANRANILAGNRRMLFNDAMGAFQQNQQAGGDLISAGLSNTIGAYRFKKDQQAIEEANAQRNGWTTNIGNA